MLLRSIKQFSECELVPFFIPGSVTCGSVVAGGFLNIAKTTGSCHVRHRYTPAPASSLVVALDKA